MSKVRFEQDGDVGIITISDPPLNLPIALGSRRLRACLPSSWMAGRGSRFRAARWAR
jgi:hypothetical protein